MDGPTSDSGLMHPLRPRYDWVVPEPAPFTPDALALAGERGVSSRLLRALSRRGLTTAGDMRAVLDPPEVALNDPLLLPDADAFVERVRRAVAGGERVQVLGDFDADGLTGLAIMVLALRRLGLDVAPYVPSRLDEGHGLSLQAVRLAEEEGRRLIVTVDCGTTSVAEVAAAREAGLDVLITDHHAIPPVLPAAVALVNAHLPGSRYPDPQLSGAGVAFKLAQAVLADQPGGPEAALELADLAAVGSVADLVPLTGENRAIVRLGLRKLAQCPRPGLAALLSAGGVGADRVDVDAISFTIAPRINAVGRVGDAMVAAQLLLADDPEEAAGLARLLEDANSRRREILAVALAEARMEADLEPDVALTIVRGPWPAGVIGLVAGRLAEEKGRPAVVFSSALEPWRGSARSAGGFDLAAAFGACGDLFDRFGGHPAAAGCHMPAENYAAFRERIRGLASAGSRTPARPSLRLDLVLRANSVDYVLLRELRPLDDGAGAPPLVGIAGLVAGRVRAVTGGHTQMTLRKGNEVIDAISFGRADLADSVVEGATVDVVARLRSRSFGGYESLQLELRDVGPAGWLAAAARGVSSAQEDGTESDLASGAVSASTPDEVAAR